MSGFDEMIATLDRLARAPVEGAKLAAPAVESALRATAAAGTDTDGHPWPLTKDGKKALAHSPEHIRVTSAGTLVRATLSGPDVFHHFGGGRNPRRQVLPDPGAIPPGVAKALDRASALLFERLTA